MSWFQQNQMEEIDDHDQPTEPLPPRDTVLVAPTIAGGTPLPGDITLPYGGAASPDEMLPMPRPDTHPFPSKYVEDGAGTQSPLGEKIYPILPAGPTGAKKGRPTGGAASVQPESVPTRPAQKEASARRSLVPLLVGMGFVVLQLLLLMRFVLKIVSISAGSSWVSAVYGVTEVFVLPFQGLLQQVHAYIPASVELSTLCAVLVYGLLSRILVRFLKVVLNR